MSLSESSVFLLANGLLLFSAVRVADRCLPGCGASHRVLATLIAFGAMVHLVVVGLGMPGWLGPVPNLLASATIAATCWAITRRAPASAVVEVVAEPSPHDIVTRTVPLLLFAAIASAWVWETVVSGTNLSIDDLTYHATEAAYWVQQGAIRPSPFQYQTYYPHLAEVFAYWFMFPSRTDCVASLTGLYAGALGATAVWSIAESMGAARPFKLLACCLFLCAPIIQLNAHRTISSKDVLCAATLAAGMACLLAARGGGRSALSRHAALAGVAWGLAAAASANGVLLVPIAIVWLLRESWSEPPRSRVGVLASFAVPCMLVGALWYVQNWIVTGNPMFPFQIGPFDGPISSEVAAKTSVLWWIQNRFDDPSVRHAFLTSLCDWPYPFAIAVTGTLVLSAVSLFGKKLRGRHTDLMVVLLIAVAWFLAIWLIQPFSATPADYFNDGIKGPKFRFLGFLPAIGTALIGTWAARAPRRAQPVLVIAAAGLIAWSWLEGFGKPLVMLLVAAGVAGWLVWASRRRASAAAIVRRLTMVPIGFALLIGIAAWSPHKRLASDAKLMSAHDGGVAGVFRVLFSLPDGSRVACFNGLPFAWTRWYPAFGRRLNLVPVALDRHGEVQEPLHVHWREHRTSNYLAMAFIDANLRVDAPRFRRRLAEHHIDFVFVTKWTFGSNEVVPWPPQYDALASAGYPALYSDEMSVIWDVRSGPATVPRR